MRHTSRCLNILLIAIFLAGNALCPSTTFSSMLPGSTNGTTPVSGQIPVPNRCSSSPTALLASPDETASRDGYQDRFAATTASIGSLAPVLSASSLAHLDVRTTIHSDCRSAAILPAYRHVVRSLSLLRAGSSADADRSSSMRVTPLQLRAVVIHQSVTGRIPAIVTVQSAASIIDIANDHTTITATVYDSSDLPVSGVTVAFTSAWYSPDLIPSKQTPYGILSTAKATTDSSGLVTVTLSSGASVFMPNPVTVMASVSSGSSTITGTTLVKFFISKAAGGTGTMEQRYLGTTTAAPFYYVYTPNDYAPTQSWPMIMALHAMGETYAQFLQTNLRALVEAPTRHVHYILVCPEGRPIKVDAGRPGTRGLWFDAPDFGTNDVNAQHNESDLLQIVQAMEQNYNVDPQRVDLTGFSMGGVGAYGVGLRNPGIFAAGAPMSGATDIFEELPWLKFSGQTNIVAAVTEVLGDYTVSPSPLVSTSYLMASARFLAENAMYYPMHVWHGELDTIIPDSAQGYSTPPGYPGPYYLHAHNMDDQPGFTDSRGTVTTFPQLAAQYPGTYTTTWTISSTFGHSLFASYTDLLDWFDQYRLPAAPTTLALKTYDDHHVTYWQNYPMAYYAHIKIVNPNNGLTGGILRLSLDRSTQTITTTMDSLAQTTLNTVALGLKVSQPMTINVTSLNGWTGTLEMGIMGNWGSVPAETLSFNGRVLQPGDDYTISTSVLTLTALSVGTTPGVLTISPGNIATPTATALISTTATPMDTSTPASTATPVPSPALGLSPTSGVFGKPITATGTFFGPDEAVSLFLDSTQSTPLVTGTSSSGGTVVLTTTVPSGVLGAHTFIAVGRTSGLAASAPFQIMPGIALTVYSGNPGTLDVIHGTGFAADEQIQAHWSTPDGLLLGTTMSNGTGRFSGATAITFTVPLSPAGSYRVYGIGQSSNASARNTFLLTQ